MFAGTVISAGKSFTVATKKDLALYLNTQYEKEFKLKLDAKTEEIKLHIQSVSNSAPLIAFIKGTKQEPKCKFSRSLIQIITSTGLDFET